MITRFHVKNYKCLRDVDVQLKPFTVLIGKNDTGKTSFLEAVETLAILAGPSQDRWVHQPVEKLAWRGATPPTIEWNAEIAPSPRNHLTEAASYHLGIAPGKGKRNGFSVAEETLSTAGASIRVEPTPPRTPLRLIAEDGDKSTNFDRYSDRSVLSASWGNNDLQRICSVAQTMSAVATYRFSARLLAEPADPGTLMLDPEQEPRLRPDGYGLPAVLDYLLGARRSAFDAIQQELHEAVPFVKSILLKSHRVLPNGPMGKAISFELSETGYDISADLASDGVLLFLAYLTLVHSPSGPSIILLEEPENGIHPWQLKRIAEYLKRLTDPSRGTKAVQIVVATHSPYFLDFVPPEDVLVFGRKPNGETVAAPILTLPGVQKRIESGFSLGEMWFNVGEDRLLADLVK
ncbi:MAG: AAA family ATPase [Minicystis sp.]